MNSRKGSDLHPADRAHVLRAYVHRFTGDHRPAWARKPLPNGEPAPVQFASDADWLEHTTFAVRKDGRLDHRVRSCRSRPTWPNGRPALPA